MRRINVAGQGALTACGFGADLLWQAAVHGKSDVRHVDMEALPRQKVFSAAVLSGEDEARFATMGNPRMQDRVARMAVVAIDEAVAQAGLTGRPLGSRCGFFLGVGFGGAETLDKNYTRFARG